MRLRVIAYKYHAGKVKRTLRRRLQVPEAAEKKVVGGCVLCVVAVSSLLG